MDKNCTIFFHDGINLLVSQSRLECWREELGKSSLYGFDVTGPTIDILSITTVLLFLWELIVHTFSKQSRLHKCAVCFNERISPSRTSLDTSTSFLPKEPPMVTRKWQENSPFFWDKNNKKVHPSLRKHKKQWYSDARFFPYSKTVPPHIMDSFETLL